MARQATQTVAPPADTPVAARSPYLDASLDRAHKLAVSQHHAGVTSEHLLFTLTEDPEALGVLGASTISIERLRADITTHLSQLPHETAAGKPVLPTADLLKVLKLAAMAAQQSSRRQIDGAIVLAAIIGDATTPSAGLLRAHGLTFGEVIRVLQKGSAVPPPQASSQAPPVSLPPVSVPEPAKPAHQQSSVETAPGAPPRRDNSSTDEILASVRARLQEAAPPVVIRRPESTTPSTTPPATVEAAKPPASPGVAAALLPPVPPVSEQPPSLPIAAAAPPPAAAEPSHQPEPQRAPPPMPPQLPAHGTALAAPPVAPIAATGPRTPDDLLPAKPTAALKQALPPPIPPNVPSVQHRMPPPLMPLAASLPPNVTAALQPKPLASPSSSNVNAARQQNPPPIPPVTVDMRALVNAMPKVLRNGQTDIIEITVPRRALEIPFAPGHRWPPLRVATLRLKAAGDRAYVEMASPETLWIGPPRAHQGADDATWRWRVSPCQNGRLKLTLSGATRIVGSEGISPEIPFGEETIEIDITRRRSRRGLVGVLLFGNLIAVGILAMIMSGRAAEIVRGAWSGIRSLWGG